MAKKSTMPKRGKAPAPKPVSAEPENGDEQQLTDLEHSEELDRMVDRLRGLQVAVEGLLEGGLPADFMRNGVYRLIEDVCDKMQDCADTFHADRQASMAEARREQALRVLGEEVKRAWRTASKGCELRRSGGE